MKTDDEVDAGGAESVHVFDLDVLAVEEDGEQVRVDGSSVDEFELLDQPRGNGVELFGATPQGGIISPLLSNIYLHVLDTVWELRYAHLGTLVRYADDFVVMSRTVAQCEEAEGRVREILTGLGLELHPEKTRRVDLSWGRQGFDFLGCHLHKRMSGRIWEQQGEGSIFSRDGRRLGA